MNTKNEKTDNELNVTSLKELSTLFKLHYFDGGGSQALKVSYKGPGGSRQTIQVDKLMYREE